MSELSLVLLPTLACNASCTHCYQERSPSSMTPENIFVLFGKLADYILEHRIDCCSVIWQGGEPLTLGAEWFQDAFKMVHKIQRLKGVTFNNQLITNLMGYDRDWAATLNRFFGPNISTSLDYPNVYRRIGQLDHNEYNKKWLEKASLANQSGTSFGLVSVINQESIDKGADSFYSYYVDEMKVKSFQLNFLFCANRGKGTKLDLPSNSRLARFLIDLFDIYVEKGFQRGINLLMFDRLIHYFRHGDPRVLPCEWRTNCSELLFCIDPDGNVMQCDHWISFPEFWFGNIFSDLTLSQIMSCQKRQNLLQRPRTLITTTNCGECEYLGLCHGGCPARSLSVYGSYFFEDPYCIALKSLFSHIEIITAKFDLDVDVN